MDPAIPVHPTFLYESLWCALGFVILYIMLKKYRKFDGQLFLGYGIWYAIGRSVIEGLRTDRKSTRLNSSHIGSSRMPSSA